MVSLKNVRPLPARRSKVFGIKEKSCKSPSVGLKPMIIGSEVRRSTYVATESLDTNNAPQSAIYLLWRNF